MHEKVHICYVVWLAIFQIFSFFPRVYLCVLALAFLLNICIHSRSHCKCKKAVTTKSLHWPGWKWRMESRWFDGFEKAFRTEKTPHAFKAIQFSILVQNHMVDALSIFVLGHVSSIWNMYNTIISWNLARKIIMHNKQSIMRSSITNTGKKFQLSHRGPPKMGQKRRRKNALREEREKEMKQLQNTFGIQGPWGRKNETAKFTNPSSFTAISTNEWKQMYPRKKKKNNNSNTYYISGKNEKWRRRRNKTVELPNKQSAYKHFTERYTTNQFTKVSMVLFFFWWCSVYFSLFLL